MEWVDALRFGGAGTFAFIVYQVVKMWMERDVPKANVMEKANAVSGNTIERLDQQLESQAKRLEEAFKEIKRLGSEIESLRADLRLAEDYAYDAAAWIDDAWPMMQNKNIPFRRPPRWTDFLQRRTETNQEGDAP